MSEARIAKFFAAVYSQAPTVRNAISGVDKSGLNLYNLTIFKNKDFIAVDVTDRPMPLPSESGMILGSAENILKDGPSNV